MKDVYLEKKDYTYLKWSKIRSSSGTAGSFLKATESIKGIKKYYKLSNYNSVQGIVGHECINEIIAGRLMEILGIHHLEYRLRYGTVLIDKKPYDAYFCESDSFRKQNERTLSLETYYEIMKKQNESPMEFVLRNHWDIQIYQMILVDFLILNRDRHGANIELIRDAHGNVRLAPLFDQGLSLLFNCHSEQEISDFDIMKDRPVQSFLGTTSVKKNLEFIKKKGIVTGLKQSDKQIIFAGLENVISKIHRDKIWQMIWERWRYYEGMFNL